MRLADYDLNLSLKGTNLVLRRHWRQLEPDSVLLRALLRGSEIDYLVPLKSNGQRNWEKMKNDELVSCTKSHMERHGIAGRKELSDKDHGLYQILRKRGLIESVVPLNENANDRGWALMRDEEVIDYYRSLYVKEGIRLRSQLEKADQSLYKVMKMRNLLDAAGLVTPYSGHRSWASLSDEEIINNAKRFIIENKIKSRQELYKADVGLHSILVRRRLNIRVGLESTQENNADWAAKGDMELVSFAKELIANNGIQRRMGLKRADSGLYQALRRRNLLDEVGIKGSKKERRNWIAMGDEELLGYAKEYIKKNGIEGMGDLRSADSGLHSVLMRRRLLEVVFSDIESSKHANAVDGVLDALDSFGEEKIKSP